MYRIPLLASSVGPHFGEFSVEHQDFSSLSKSLQKRLLPNSSNLKRERYCERVLGYVHKCLLSRAKHIHLGSNAFNDFWSNTGGSGTTIFIVRGDFRACEIAKSVGVSAEKCEPIDTPNPRTTIFVVRERFRGVEFWKSFGDLAETCSARLILRHTRRKPCKT